jgi:serine/threonine protein kinase
MLTCSLDTHQLSPARLGGPEHLAVDEAGPVRRAVPPPPLGGPRLRNDLARDQMFQARFRREAQSAASLNHPSIVAVYDTGEDMVGGTPVPYIVMEFVEGRTLHDLLRDGKRLPPKRAAETTDGVLRVLDYSHRNGIVHRHIKPGNVILTRSGDVKVMDFGIARAVSDSQLTMTQTAQAIGTPTICPRSRQGVSGWMPVATSTPPAACFTS